MTCQAVTSLEPSRLHRLLLAYYRILQANRPLPRNLFWPLSALSKLFLAPHPDRGVCLLSIRCYAVQSGMGEDEREKLDKEVLGEICGGDCRIGYGENVSGSPKEIDGWLLPVLEIQRATDSRNALVTEPQDFYSFQDGDHGPSLIISDLRLDLSITFPILSDISPVLLLHTFTVFYSSEPLVPGRLQFLWSLLQRH